MRIIFEEADVTKVKCDLLTVNEFEGVIKPGGATGAVDKALNGLISHLSSKGEISGKLYNNNLIHSQGKISADHILVAGLGKSSEFNLDKVRNVSAKAVNEAKKIRAKRVATIVHGAGIGGLDPFKACRAVIEGAILANYKFEDYKKEKDSDETFQIDELIIIEKNPSKIKDYKKAVEIAQISTNATNKARDLVNTPANKLTPNIFSQIAKKITENSGLKYELLEKKDIIEMGMDALYSVAKGSKEDPCVVVLKYFGAKKSKIDIGLIGKGITFDSGGLSLKTPKHMEDMKIDMAGAAAVLCVMEAASKLKIKKNILAVIPLTENMPDGASSKPGDVISSMHGKTVEIISTDAEGRMILADAITYAKDKGAQKIIDIATLTGACVTALGDVASGILGNDQKMIEEIIESGEMSGEKLWQLPMYDEYKEYLKSTIADTKNCSGLGKAGTSSGALFLKEFVGDTPWAHIDIAGTAHLDREIGPYSKGATGAGVFTILNYLMM